MFYVSLKSSCFSNSYPGRLNEYVRVIHYLGIPLSPAVNPLSASEAAGHTTSGVPQKALAGSSVPSS